MIEIKKLHKNYDGLKVLKGIDLDIKKGEIVAVVGHSGSGKSTLLRCLAQIELVSSGQILIDETDITVGDKQAKQILTKVGMVFQQFNLFPHLTVLENVILAPQKVLKMDRNEAIKQAKKLLKQLGVGDKIDVYPNSLSGGQQQRVAIVRELIRQPKVLLFDEPTSALDPENVDEVESIIRELSNQDMTIVVVSHDINFGLHVAQRIIFLDKGRIIADQTPSKIIKSKDSRVASFFGSALND